MVIGFSGADYEIKDVMNASALYEIGRNFV